MIITDVYGNTFSGNGRRCQMPLFADRQKGVPALVSSGGIYGVSSRLAYHSPTGDIEVISRSIATKENTSSATAVILFAVALSLATRHSCLATDVNALATHHSCLATRANILATRYFYSVVDKNDSFIHHFHYTDDKTIAQNGAKQLKGNYSEYFTTYFYN